MYSESKSTRAPGCSLFTSLLNTKVLHYSVQLALNSPERIQSCTTVLERKESLKVFVWHTSFMFSSQSKKNRYMCPLSFRIHWTESNGLMVWKR